MIVRDALTNLPKTLDETYERIFQAIPDDERLIVLSALKWIFFHEDVHTGDISITVLIGAIDRTISIATSTENHIFLDQDRLRDICGCLITITPESSRYTQTFSTSSFAHYTVWEFITSERISQSRAAQFSIKAQKTRIELTNITLRTVLDLTIDCSGQDCCGQDCCGQDCCEACSYSRSFDFCPDCSSHASAGFDEYFAVFCALSSICSLRRDSYLISNDPELTYDAFELMDSSKAHFTVLQKILSRSSQIHQSESSLARLRQMEWQPSERTNVTQQLAMLLVIDETRSLAQKLIAQNDQEHIFRDELDVKFLWGEQWFAFRGSIIDLFAQLGSGFFDQFKAVLQLQEHVIDPPKTLLSFICGAGYNLAPGPLEFVLTKLKMATDIDCAEFSVTPLQIVTDNCNYEAVRTLLDAGADPNYAGNQDGIRWEADTFLGRLNHLCGHTPIEIWESHTYSRLHPGIGALLRGEEIQTSHEDLEADESVGEINEDDGKSDFEH